MTRYKVWTVDPDGEPSTILVRTGSTETLDSDTPVVFESGTLEVIRLARFAWGRAGLTERPRLLVKDFDAAWFYEVNDHDGMVVVTSLGEDYRR